MIRAYHLRDEQQLGEWLAGAGVSREHHRYTEGETWVLDLDGKRSGFFTWKWDQRMPHLVHFFIAPEARGLAAARELVKAFCLRIKGLGRKTAIINTLACKPFLRKFVEYYFRRRPYAEVDGHNFFLVEV